MARGTDHEVLGPETDGTQAYRARLSWPAAPTRAKLASNPFRQARSKHGMTSLAEPLSGRTILLVDDDRAVRYILVRTLQEAGYGVVEAGDGAQAWTCFEDNPRRFDAVVTDVVMPRMSGTVLAARVHASRPSLPVLLMSAYSPAELLERGLEAAHGNLMSKPFNPDQLVAAVRQILGEETGDA